MRKHNIKLNVKSERQLNKLTPCSICNTKVKYRNLFFYVDESNISITNNSRGLCVNCK